MLVHGSPDGSPEVCLDSFFVNEGEEVRQIAINGPDVLAATDEYLYRLSFDLNELRRRLIVPNVGTRLLLATNSGLEQDVVLICGMSCRLVDAQNIRRNIWPAGGPTPGLDSRLVLNTSAAVKFTGVLRRASGQFQRRYELTYAQNDFIDRLRGGESIASRIVRGNLIRGNRTADGMTPEADDLFQTTASQIELDPFQEREFIHTFTRNGFAYFVSVMAFASGVQARVARVCDSSDEGTGNGEFCSYIELGLQCGDLSGEPTAATFITAPNAFGADAIVLSVRMARLSEVRNRLCAFNLTRIDEMMDGKMRDCANGTGLEGLARNAANQTTCTALQDPQDCRLSPLEVDTLYTATQFLLVSGLEREQESAFFSLALTLVDGYTFLFAANGDGQLFQFAILTEMESDTISVRTIDTPLNDEGENEEILQLAVSNNGLHVYMSTEYAIHRYSLDMCDTYTTCEECTTTGDIFCGWCTLESKCTRRSTCGDDVWTDSSSFCPVITETQPSTVHIEDLRDGRVTSIALLTSNLPQSLTSIACVYRISSRPGGPTDIVQRENCTSFNATSGRVQCAFSVAVKNALLDICKQIM
jgi:hypothetical protein